MDKAKRIAKAIFTRKVRASLYGAALAAVVSLISTGELPAWVLAPASPLLLALFNLNPDDVTEDDEP